MSDTNIPDTIFSVHGQQIPFIPGTTVETHTIVHGQQIPVEKVGYFAAHDVSVYKMVLPLYHPQPSQMVWLKLECGRNASNDRSVLRSHYWWVTRSFTKDGTIWNSGDLVTGLDTMRAATAFDRLETIGRYGPPSLPTPGAALQEIDESDNESDDDLAVVPRSPTDSILRQAGRAWMEDVERRQQQFDRALRALPPVEPQEDIDAQRRTLHDRIFGSDDDQEDGPEEMDPSAAEEAAEPAGAIDTMPREPDLPPERERSPRLRGRRGWRRYSYPVSPASPSLHPSVAPPASTQNAYTDGATPHSPTSPSYSPTPVGSPSPRKRQRWVSELPEREPDDLGPELANTECIVCFERPRATVFKCGHLVTCVSCARRCLGKCPKCREYGRVVAVCM